MELIAGSELRISSVRALTKLEESGFTSVEADMYATNDVRFLRGFRAPYYLFCNNNMGYRISAFPGNFSTYRRYLAHLQKSTSLEILPTVVSTRISTLKNLVERLTNEGFTHVVVDLGLTTFIYKDLGRKALLKLLEEVLHLIDDTVIFKIDIPTLALCRLFDLLEECNVIVQSIIHRVDNGKEVLKWFIPLGAEQIASLIHGIDVESWYVSPAFLELQEYSEIVRTLPKLRGLELVHLPLTKGFSAVMKIKKQIRRVESKIEISLLRELRHKFNTLIIDENACTLCGLCVDTCPSNAIEIVDERIIVYDNICRGCGICTLICPRGLIRLARRVEVEMSE